MVRSDSATDSSPEDESDILSTCPLETAVRLYEEDKIMEAGRVLRKVLDKPTNDGLLYRDKLNDIHYMILRLAEQGENLVDELKSTVVQDAHQGWIFQGRTRSSSNLHTNIYYRLEMKNNQQVLKCRLETPIPDCMVIPILSVCNETELYCTWLPHWSIPRLQIHLAKKLAQVGRVAQSLLFIVEPPWPLTTREVLVNARAFDDVDARGEILVHITSDENEFGNLVEIPPTATHHVRMDFDSTLLFRKLPNDYPHSPSTGTEDAKTVLLTCTLIADPKVGFIPQPLLNFATKIAIGTVWNRLLHVSQEVKNGDRPAHSQAIDEKRATLYDWANKRVECMISMLNELCDSSEPSTIG